MNHKQRKLHSVKPYRPALTGWAPNTTCIFFFGAGLSRGVRINRWAIDVHEAPIPAPRNQWNEFVVLESSTSGAMRWYDSGIPSSIFWRPRMTLVESRELGQSLLALLRYHQIILEINNHLVSSAAYINSINELAVTITVYSKFDNSF